MAKRTIATNEVRFQADGAPYIQEVKQVEAANRRLQGQALSVSQAVRSFGNATTFASQRLTLLGSRLVATARSFISIRGTIATVAGSAGLGLLVKNSVAATAEIGRTAERIAASSRDVSAFAFAATSVGASVEDARDAVQELTQRIGEASTGMGELFGTFEDLGRQQDLTRLLNAEGLTEQVRTLRDILQDIPDAGQRQFLIDSIFGGDVADRLEEAIVRFPELFEEAIRSGSIVNDEQTQQARDAAEAFAQLGTQLQLAISKEVTNNMEGIVNAAQGLVRIAPKVIKFFVDSVEGFSRVVDIVSPADNLSEQAVQDLVGAAMAGNDATARAIIAGDVARIQPTAPLIEERRRLANLRGYAQLPGAGSELFQQATAAVPRAQAAGRALDFIADGIERFGGSGEILRGASVAISDSVRRLRDPAAYVEELDRTLQDIDRRLAHRADFVRQQERGPLAVTVTEARGGVAEDTTPTFPHLQDPFFQFNDETQRALAKDAEDIDNIYTRLYESKIQNEQAAFLEEQRLLKGSVLSNEQYANLLVSFYEDQNAREEQLRQESLDRQIDASIEFYDKLQEQRREDLRNLEDLMSSSERAFENFTFSAIKNFSDIGDAFRNLATDIADEVLRLSVVQPAAQGFASLIGDVAGSVFSGTFGGAPVPATGPSFNIPSTVGGAPLGSGTRQVVNNFHINSADGPAVARAINDSIPGIVDASNGRNRQVNTRVGGGWSLS